MSSSVYPVESTNSYYLLLNITIIPPHNCKISLIFCDGYHQNMASLSRFYKIFFGLYSSELTELLPLSFCL